MLLAKLACSQCTKHAGAMGAEIEIVCAQTEVEISELEEEDRMEFLKELGIEEPGLNKLANATYQFLDLQTYFTACENKMLLVGGSKLPPVVGNIHSGFERGFRSGVCNKPVFKRMGL